MSYYLLDSKGGRNGKKQYNQQMWGNLYPEIYERVLFPYFSSEDLQNS